MSTASHRCFADALCRDDMGLGKTVQMIATMAMNMPDLEAAHRSTLIVVPAALLQQVKTVSYLSLTMDSYLPM
jgi:SNF2 family DNA or RNA helicase